MFVSFNDGGDWQSLDLNLPPVPITDLTIRHDNLVIATQGRGFWVLDDLYLVRQFAAGPSDQPMRVFAREAVSMMSTGGRPRNFEGANPAGGVTLYYYLDEASEDPLAIEIFDSEGELVRSYSSEESDFDRCKLANMDPRRPFELKYPKAGKGLNKWSWDMKRDGITCLEDISMFSGFSGANVAPGDYSAKISTGELAQTVSFSLVPDPRVDATSEEVQAWTGHLDEVTALMNEVLTSLGGVRKAQQQIEALMADYADAEQLQETGAAAIERIEAWDATIDQVLHQTYEDEDAWETMLGGQIRHLLDVISATGAPVTDGALLRLADLKAEWSERKAELEAIRMENIEVIDQWAREQGVPHVTSPGS
jgi:hypothetical protein